MYTAVANARHIRSSARACQANPLAPQNACKRRYLGRIVGSPPGLPGGGITGVLPVSRAGACISGSIPGGGHSTPSARANLSPSGSARCPVVVPSGAAVPECGAGCIGAQLAARSGDGGAVRAGGVVGPGGACAPATLEAAVNTHERSSARFIPMWENGLRSRRFRN